MKWLIVTAVLAYSLGNPEIAVSDELPIASKGNAVCWEDDNRQDISCQALTERFLLSMRGAKKLDVWKAMGVKGREFGNGLHFLSNYSKGERWGSGSVNFTFDAEGRVVIIVASVDPPSMAGKSVDFVWNVFAAPPLGTEIDRSTRDFERLPYCSDFPGASTKCTGRGIESELLIYQMSFNSSTSEILELLETSCNLGHSIATSDPNGDCIRLRSRLQ
jgi:hypothetical protein